MKDDVLLMMLLAMSITRSGLLGSMGEWREEDDDDDMPREARGEEEEERL